MPRSLLNAYDDVPRPLQSCAMVAAHAALGQARWDELLILANRPDVEAARLGRALRSLGVSIGDHTVARHLNGECKSCAARGDFV